MIVPMKKVSLIIAGDKKTQALKTLRNLGIVHIDITEKSQESISQFKEQISLLDNALYTIGKTKNEQSRETDVSGALSIAKQIISLTEEKKQCISERIALEVELERLKGWGNIDPNSILELLSDGIELCLFEASPTEYEQLPDSIRTVRLDTSKTSVKFLILSSGSEEEVGVIDSLKNYRLTLPKMSCSKMREKIGELNARIEEVELKISSYSDYYDSIRAQIAFLEKEVEFQTYATGMDEEKLCCGENKALSVAYFKGYIEEENLDKLKETASHNSWGLLVENPVQDDNVPTKLKNNKFVSLIYPIMDFLGTVPGYFEYDISGWFLAFILVFFGIIFGDGGYGLLISAVSAILIVKSLISKKTVPPTFLLIGLFGLSTILWGTLTCTWFGLSPEQLPYWLKALSIPVISNVYADKLWSLPWTQQGVGLTTAQNVQIFCFTLALIQLTVAHIKGAVRNRRSMKILGDIGSIFQLLGIYYLVLSLVVNSEVFTFGLILGGIPIGTVSVALIAVGFLISFVFSNYEGNIGESVLSSCKNIVSVLLGVVNVFSDIVSYIRLWAVGLAGAAISATINELVGPFFSNFILMIVAIILLVFGHGLNIVLNVLSVIVHGIRLNTLEFSSHLDMSWSGHKFKPFEE